MSTTEIRLDRNRKFLDKNVLRDLCCDEQHVNTVYNILNASRMKERRFLKAHREMCVSNIDEYLYADAWHAHRYKVSTLHLIYTTNKKKCTREFRR